MRLPRPFYRLPVRFDVERLRAEVAALPDGAWVPHPNHIAGNSAVRLITAGGAESDAVDGPMQPTAHLRQSAYLRQILASFKVVWSRSRLLRLAPGASVPEHADINYHWFNRVRLHIPVMTHPGVRFHCGGQSVHMAAGEAWLFDNWRLHGVENPTAHARIHLVADTSGSSPFWQFVAQSESASCPLTEVRYDPAADAHPLTECAALAPVMTPGEVDLLVMDLRAELTPQEDSREAPARLARYHALLDGFCRDWRQLYSLHGADRPGWAELARLRDTVRQASRIHGEGLVMRTNRVAAHAVLEGRVLHPMLTTAADSAAHRRPNTPSAGRLRQPVFIVAAPRSGSTLLFETLAVSEQLYTLGGEGHALIESIPELQPGAARLDSNRLDAEHASDEICERIADEVLRQARDARGDPPPAGRVIRFLEKTPKNALRVPFLDRLFPDARFIFLWRDPRENLSSIMEAWRSGRWKTYNGLPGFEGPWSLLLPPGWRAMNGRTLEEIAAFQWDRVHRIVLDDLAMLPRERWTVTSYARLLEDPEGVMQELCAFACIDFDRAMAEHVTKPLPLSRYTLTPPHPGKWRLNAAEIERVLPSLADTWQRLRELHQSPQR